MEVDPRAQAVVFLEAGQVDRAREVLRAYLAEQPTDGTAHLILARAAASTGDLSVAEQHARSAAADSEVRPAALQTLSKIIGLDDRRAKEAVDAAAEAVRLEPEDWSHRAALALALADLRDLPNAIAQADAAVHLAPNDPEERASALVAMARVLLTDPVNRRRGYELMREAAALDPMDPSIQQQVMIAQFQSGRRAEAVATALGHLRTAPTAAVPPLIARLSIYLLIRRLLGWSLLAAFAVPLVFLGFIGSAGEPSLLTTSPDIIVRAASLTGLILFALVAATVLRPLADAATARAVRRFARRSALAWSGGILWVVAVLCYLTGLIFGAVFFPSVPLPFLLMLVAWIVHSWGALAYRVPSAAALLAQRGGR